MKILVIIVIQIVAPLKCQVKNIQRTATDH